MERKIPMAEASQLRLGLETIFQVFGLGEDGQIFPPLKWRIETVQVPKVEVAFQYRSSIEFQSKDHSFLHHLSRLRNKFLFGVYDRGLLLGFICLVRLIFMSTVSEDRLKKRSRKKIIN